MCEWSMLEEGEVDVGAGFNWTVWLPLCRLLSFPTNLINATDTRRGIARAFTSWSDVSPFSFREVPADEEADIKIGANLLVGGSHYGNCSTKLLLYGKHSLHALRHLKI